MQRLPQGASFIDFFVEMALKQSLSDVQEICQRVLDSGELDLQSLRRLAGMAKCEVSDVSPALRDAVVDVLSFLMRSDRVEALYEVCSRMGRMTSRSAALKRDLAESHKIRRGVVYTTDTPWRLYQTTQGVFRSHVLTGFEPRSMAELEGIWLEMLRKEGEDLQVSFSGRIGEIESAIIRATTGFMPNFIFKATPRLSRYTTLKAMTEFLQGYEEAYEARTGCQLVSSPYALVDLSMELLAFVFKTTSGFVNISNLLPQTIRHYFTVLNMGRKGAKADADKALVTGFEDWMATQPLTSALYQGDYGAEQMGAEHWTVVSTLRMDNVSGDVLSKEDKIRICRSFIEAAYARYVERANHITFTEIDAFNEPVRVHARA